MAFTVGPLSIAVIAFFSWLFRYEIGRWLAAGWADGYFIAGSIICVWLIMLGAKWPRILLFWAWIVFWILRGFIFV